MSAPPAPIVARQDFFYLLMEDATSRAPAAGSARQCAEPGTSRRPGPGLPCDPLGNGLRRRRPAEAEALERMNAGGAQEQMLLGGFHAFRRDFHAEPPPEAHG